MSERNTRRKKHSGKQFHDAKDKRAGESAPNGPPESPFGRISRTLNRLRSGWALFLAFCTMTGLVTFWPRVTISMVSDPEQKLWLYVVNNDSFFSAKDVQGDCAITNIGVDWQGGNFAIQNLSLIHISEPTRH